MYLSISLSIHLSIYLSIYLFINLSIYIYIYLSIYLSIYLYIYMYIYIGSPTFYSCFSESFSGEYHMYQYQFIPLQICDYLCKISLEANVATDKGNGRSETCTFHHWGVNFFRNGGWVPVLVGIFLFGESVPYCMS